MIAPKSEAATKIANSLGLEYIDENTLLDHDEFINWVKTNKLSQNYASQNWNWYYQQFLKLLYYKQAQTNYYFVIDADIVFKRPLVLVSDNGIRTFFISNYNAGHEISKTSIK